MMRWRLLPVLGLFGCAPFGWGAEADVEEPDVPLEHPPVVPEAGPAPVGLARAVVPRRAQRLAVSQVGACVRAGSDVYCFALPTLVPSLHPGCVEQYGDIEYECWPKPTKMRLPGDPRSSGFVHVTGKFETYCGILESGQAACWGYGMHGGLGDGSSPTSNHPVTVKDSRDVVDLAVGAAHSCALSSEGRVSCWGLGRDGELGTGERADAPTPVFVDALPPVEAIFAGAFHTCATTGAGELYCWGSNNTYQLGDKTAHDRLRPGKVEGLPPIAEVSASSQDTCARTTRGAVWCWGSGPVVGAEPNARRRQPTLLPALPRVRALAVSIATGCAHLHDGSVQCWGDNGFGGLGDGSRRARFEPAPVSGLDDVVELAASELTCALTGAGDLYCWGVLDVLTPIRVELPVPIETG